MILKALSEVLSFWTIVAAHPSPKIKCLSLWVKFTKGVDTSGLITKIVLANTILVINPEVSTPFVNFTHRDKHFIFGDGCAATIVQKDSTSDKAFKIIDRKLHTQFSNNIRSDYSYLNRAAIDTKNNEDLLFH